MAIKVDNPPPNATRGKPFRITVNFSETSGGSVNRVEVEFDKMGDPITIIEGSSSFTSQGTYFADWQDIFTYVDEGESDKTQEPKTVINTNNLPPDKQMYNLDQDQRGSIDRPYYCTVYFTSVSTDPVTGATSFQEGIENVTVIHTVDNDLEAIRSFMDNYNYNKYKQKNK